MAKLVMSKECTKIIDSYTIPKDEISILVEAIIYKRIKEFLPVTRDYKSYVREIRAHNRLYKLGLFHSHTKDCDLEESIKWYYELLYLILGW